MASQKRRSPAHDTPADSSKAVDKFMLALRHPLKSTIQAIRTSILGVDPTIAEGIKWNAPSYRTVEYFATTNLREKKGIGIILHLGARPLAAPSGGMVIKDPAKLLQWLARDRAAIVFESLDDFEDKRAAFERIIRQWIVHVERGG